VASGRTIIKIFARALIILLILALTAGCIIITHARVQARLAAEQEAIMLMAQEQEITETPDNSASQILVPGCEVVNYLIADGTCDFSYTNPEENNCYLKVSITRNDTSETLYASSLISPGNCVDNVILFPELTLPGAYSAMLKVDAYAIDKMSFLNSLVTNIIINAQ